MMLRWFIKVLSVFAMVVAVLSGCRTAQHPRSAIVTEVEAAGSGPLDGLDEVTVQRWLGGHPEVAKRVALECKAAGAKAPATWAMSTEGVVCTADAQVMFTMPTKLFKPF